jgi:hypothetical protein
MSFAFSGGPQESGYNGETLLLGYILRSLIVNKNRLPVVGSGRATVKEVH